MNYGNDEPIVLRTPRTLLRCPYRIANTPPVPCYAALIVLQIQSTPTFAQDVQGRSSRQAKPSTAVGKPRSGDGSNTRALNRSWTRPEATASAEGEGGGEGGGLPQTSSASEAGLDIGEQAAALGLYA